MAQSSETKLNKIFDQDVQITGNLTVDGNLVGFSGDNFYLDGITKSGNTLTFSVNGTTNQTYTFGSAAFANTTAFAAASHSHPYLSNDSDSEQTVGSKINYFNSGGLRMNMDPRWNEGGYDGDNGNLHIWSTKANGGNYGRAGLALYNGSAYQYLTTKGGQNALYHNNNEIITSSSIGSQSVSYATSAGNASSASSVAWGNISGKPSTFPASSHDHDRLFITDTRGAQRAPSYYNDRYAQWDFQNQSDTGAGGDAWHALQTISPWSTYDNNHRQQQLVFTGTGGMKFRYATSDSAWAGWQTIWTSGNDGSGSGLDADRLDGVEASSFVRSDVDDTITGDLLINTGATQNGIRFRTTNGDFVGRYSNYVSLYNQTSGSEIRMYDSDYIILDSPDVRVAGNHQVIHGGNIGSQTLPWANITSKPASWLSTTNLITNSNPNATAFPSGFYEHSDGANTPTGTWFNYINVRHSNVGNGHGYQLGMSYYDNNLWFRSYKGGLSPTFQSWETALATGGSNQTKSGYLQSNDSLRAPIFYDSDDTSFYVNPNSTSRFDKVMTNDSGATPRYDTAFYVLQAQHWYGDNSSQTMYMGEGSNDVLIRGQVAIGGTAIQAGYALTMSGSVDLNAYDVNYVNQLHFADNVRFYDSGNDSYVIFKYGDTNNGGIRLLNGSGTQKGYLYADNDGFGLLSGDGSWAVRTTDSGTVIDHRLDTPIFYDSNDTYYYVDPASDSRQNNISSNRIGVNNSSSSSRYGISLYGGYNTGEPTYGLLFTGTSLGTHGSVTGSWATYFTMNNDNSRGWIFRRVGSGNCASISGGGTASFNGDVIAYYSDMRLKTKLGDIKDPIGKIQALNGFYYEPNEVAESYGYEKETRVGLSAQEVEAVLPEIVTDAPIGDGYKTVDYAKLVPVLVEAIKEQQKQIDELKKLINP